MNDRAFLTPASLLMLTALACGPGADRSQAPGAAAAAPSSDQKAAMLEQVVPRMCSGRSKIADLVAQGPLPPLPDALKSTAAKLAKGGKSLEAQKLYKNVAPAVVLINTPRGMGSGVIFDPKGLVLTNYHVINDGKQLDFTAEVRVRLGKLTKTGRMDHAREQPYKGVVLKADPVLDLAIVRIEEPPSKLVHVPIATTKDPEVGEAVVALGHAGIGFLWAAKSCDVSGIGEFGQHLSERELHFCKLAAEDAGDDRARRLQAACEKRRERVEGKGESINAGLMVQTTCPINHGDSGGPLVNLKGELVGINQSALPDQTFTSFHVHVAEVRKFVADISDKPAYLTPDPWCAGGQMEAYAAGHTGRSFSADIDDIDLDGNIDTLRSALIVSSVVFFDLDQDTFTKAETERGDMPFDAEAAIQLTRMADGGPQVLAWYDRAGQGRFDTLVVGESARRPRTAYRVEKDGSLVEDASLMKDKYLDASYFQNADADTTARFGRIAGVAAPHLTAWESLAAGRALKVPEDPIWGGGRKGIALDLNRNGKTDALGLSGAFSAGTLLDADESSLGEVSPGGDPQAIINSRKIDAELSLIVQGPTAWSIYDSNGDGELDTAMATDLRKGMGIAEHAWFRGKGGEYRPAPEHVGRFLLRSALTNVAGADEMFYGLSAGSGLPLAADEGLGSVPSPRRKMHSFAFRDIKGFERRAAEGVGLRGELVVAIDANGDSQLKKGASAAQAFADGSFKPDLVVMALGDKAWAYYDTNFDATPDIVLFIAGGGALGKPTSAFRVAGGKLAPDTEVANGKLIQPDLFPDAKTQKASRKIAASMFRPSVIDG